MLFAAVPPMLENCPPAWGDKLLFARVFAWDAGKKAWEADPVAVSEYVIPLPRLPITGPGTFSIDLLYSDELIGSWRLFVVEQ